MFRNFIYLACMLSISLFGGDQEILVLSTYRCGTHWSLYCLSYLLHRDVIFRRGIGEETLYKAAEDESNGYIFAGHCPKELWIKKEGDKNDLLIVVVRNYRECLMRHLGSVAAIVDDLKMQATYNWLDANRVAALVLCSSQYINNVRCYDSWDPSKRYLIFYEDLINNPMSVLLDVVYFLGEIPDENTWRFFEDLEVHKHVCLRDYTTMGGSQSKGTDNLYHSKKMGLKNCRLIDNLVEQLFPYYFHKYLKRYKLDDLST